jgi:hypothetical protein
MAEGKPRRTGGRLWRHTLLLVILGLSQDPPGNGSCQSSAHREARSALVALLSLGPII